MRNVGAARAAGAIPLGLLTLAWLLGCAGKPPVISRVFARVIFVRDLDKDMRYARLGVFMVASDPDGMDDLSAFYVINDSAELFWKVESGAWSTGTAEGESWIGTNSFAMPDANPPPEGEYRVVLQDQAGETVEDTFTLPKLEPPPQAEWPTASISSDAIAVSQASEVTELWLMGKDDTLEAKLTVPKASPRLALAGLRQSAPAAAPGAAFWVYTWSDARQYGLAVGPYKLP